MCPRSEAAFLPLTRQEASARSWDEVDFVYVTGDAYVDHSSFGTAIIARLLEAKGFRVGIIAQPSLASRGWAFWCPPATWIPW